MSNFKMFTNWQRLAVILALSFSFAWAQAAYAQKGHGESGVSESQFLKNIKMNDPFYAALDDWLTWGRPKLLMAYESYRHLRPQIAPVYKKAGFPEALLFGFIATESAGKAHAMSRAGAAGLLQFMRFTGKKYGLVTEDGFDQRFDPKKATKANADYLVEHLKVFNNSIEKTLAAYNGGENRMKNLQRKHKGKQVWDNQIYYALPKETRDYIPKVLAAAWLFTYPEHYRLDLPAKDRKLVNMRLRSNSSLSELSVCLGQEQAPFGWFRNLRNLNPKIKPEDRLKKGTRLTVPANLPAIYKRRCTDNQGGLLTSARLMQRANYPLQAPMEKYVVRRGDTAQRIASRFQCVSTRELTALNNIRPPSYVIHVGQVLQVPDC